MRIIAFPKAHSAYTQQFYRAVESLGVPVIEGDWSGRLFATQIRAGDVVHIHWPSFYYSTQGTTIARYRSVAKFGALLLLARARGARIVWTSHNLYPHGGSADAAHRLARWIISRVASVVVVHGDTARRRVSAEFGIPAAKFVTIRHGHWFDLFPATSTVAQSRAQLGIAPGTYVYGSIGLCKPYKGLEQLIDAFATMAPGAALLVAGKFQDADYQADIERRLAALAPRQVVFAPRFLTDAEMHVYVQACDVLVMPYSDILTSGSVMTAYTFGRPVIVPDKGSMREVVPELAGIVYPADAPGSLDAAMTRARHADFSAERIVAHARAHSWEEPARLLLDRLAER